MAVDYNALAQQAGAIKSVPPGGGAPIDYNALASQAGAIQPAAAPAKPDLLQQAANLTQNIPGAKLGQAIGTLGGYGIAAAQDFINHLQGNPTTLAKNYDLSAPTPLQTGADAAQALLTAAAPGVGSGGGVVSRIAGNAVLGAGLGASNELANNATPSVGGVAGKAAIGGAIGGGLSAATEGIGSIVDNLPRWFTQKAFPKLDSSNIDYALQNTKLKNVSGLLADSNSAVNSYGKQINSILQHPQYANDIGNGAQAIQDVVSSFPNAQLTPDKVVNIVKQVAPSQKDLIDKVASGDATLLEKNQLRQTLDQAVKKIFTDNPGVSYAKQIGAAFSNSLRNDVQTNAPATAPIFSEFSKEIGLRNALQAAQKKVEKGAAVGLYDIVSGLGGFIGSGGNPLAAAGAVALEKGARSPAVQLGAAKAIQAVGKAGPVAGAIVNATKVPLIKAATNP